MCQVALEDFVRLCAEARAQGTPMKELQLQLILAEGSLPAPFGKKALVPGDEGATQEGAGLAVEAEVSGEGVSSSTRYLLGATQLDLAGGP